MAEYPLSNEAAMNIARLRTTGLYPPGFEEAAASADFIVDVPEGVTTFEGFTDEEEPEAAKWLSDQFVRIEKDYPHNKENN